MNKYETIFLINPQTSETQRKEVVEKISKYIKENGEFIDIDELGIRKLAYEIKTQTHAYYYIINLACKPEAIYELERIYRITEEVLKFIIVKRDD